VEQWTKQRPFCQYAMELRGSMGWCVFDWCTTGRETITSDCSKPSWILPTSQLSRPGSSMSGNSSLSSAAICSAVHFISPTSNPAQTLPSSRAFGPPGRRLSSGSMMNGSGSISMSIAATASAAVTSSTAAMAAIGSPW
jgi:hypothetical protein